MNEHRYITPFHHVVSPDVANRAFAQTRDPEYVERFLLDLRRTNPHLLAVLETSWRYGVGRIEEDNGGLRDEAAETAFAELRAISLLIYRALKSRN